ncbi:MAG TPA: hypothetical protein VD864_00270, partial [Nocardioides sp.]|nr:hypothetical protein [Nocardioides sp.]
MGGALRAALTGGLATAVVVGGLVALPTQPAAAVSTGRPIAVAAADDGTSYVGYAAGHRLLRLDARGAVAGSVPLDQDAPVTALDVGFDGHVWVDYGASVSELATDGTVLTHFPVQAGGSCPVDRAHDPARYGGLHVTRDAVYVAGRCSATVGIHRHDGELLATVRLPGRAYPRDVVLAPAVKGLPARMYVSVPDTGRVYAYDTASLLRADPEPARTLVIKQFFGYRTPAPGPLAADEKGQLAVVDVANNAVHFYNGPESYWYYRTLGHPPDPASDRGFLDRATGFDNAGNSFRDGFWVADTGNGRVQHWDHLGTTDWMADAPPPGDPGAPVNTALPRVTGAPYAGRVLDCDPGSWDGAVASYELAWLRDGLPIAGADGSAYTVTARDVATELTCTVTARAANGASSAPTASEVFPIPGPHSPPYLLEPPAVQGTPSSGSIVRCTNGSWTGRPTSYLRGWLRDGQLLPGTNAPEYLVTDNDRYHELTCRVAAVNTHGTSKVALSVPVAVGDGGSGEHVGPPRSTARPRIVGRAKVGAVLYCDPGRWRNAPLFSYVWRRDGAALGGT